MANTCFEAIAVTKGNSPYGPYNVYYLNANYNPAEPGAPFLLNDFTKIGLTRDAFLLFYDEFPQSSSAPGIGGGGFNGAQEYAFDKNAMEKGAPVTPAVRSPNPRFNVAIENMGLLPTPNGTCASDDLFNKPGITCWFSVIPANPPDPSQFDNSHGGSGFMLESLDFFGNGDTRIAAFDWTGLSSLNDTGRDVRFGGQLFSGTGFYEDLGLAAPQKAGPIPLGDECGAAGLSVAPSGGTAPASCPEGGIETNGDNFTQVSQAQGELWSPLSTEVTQSFRSGTETHLGTLYFVVGTGSFDRFGVFSLTSSAYVSPAHEDLSMPVMAGADHGGAILAFTLTGNGGPTGADGGGFYPSTAFAQLSAFSGGDHQPGLHRSPRPGPAGRVHRVPRLPRLRPASAGATTAPRSTCRAPARSTSPTSTSPTRPAPARTSPSPWPPAAAPATEMPTGARQSTSSPRNASPLSRTGSGRSRIRPPLPVRLAGRR